MKSTAKVSLLLLFTILTAIVAPTIAHSATVALNVTKAGLGTGTVTSWPTGINCGATCAANFNLNSNVTLTVTPAYGSKFDGWSGACTGSTNTCVVAMDQAKAVTASFSLVTLTINKIGSGTGTVTGFGINCGTTCSANIYWNSNVTLTATPAANSVFDGWSGACTGMASTCIVTMDQAKAVTASFSLVKLTVNIAGTGTGTITSSPAGINCGTTCAAIFNRNSSVTLTAIPAAGFMLTGWSDACTVNADDTCTVTMSATKSVTATFGPVPIQLTVTRVGMGTGTVTSSPAGLNCGATCAVNFNQNSPITLTASPANGSTFEGWAGACSGSTSSCNLILSEAQSVTANFSLNNTALNFTTYQYDPNGNLTQVTDPLGNNHQIQYDSLDRVERQLEPDPTVTGSTLGQIDIAYDPLGQVTNITDPRNLATDYQVDNLGNVVSQTSPDTGVTQNTYDDAGNLKTRTDARGNTTAYSYDSQNRLTQAVSEDQTIAYTWDACTNGLGRLCSLANGTNTLVFSYDLHGRITGKAQTEGAVTLNISNSYSASGLLEQTTTPSGQTIDYVWHNDRLEAIDINGQPLISQIVYEPDGKIGAWTWSNGTFSERLYDLAGRPVAISLGFDTQSQWPTQRTYSYDAASRITGITDDNDHELDQIFGYDGLDRLITSQKGAATLSTSDYTYDLSGNRISKTLNNSLTETLSIDFGSNLLQQKSAVQTVNYSYDQAGNLLSDGATHYSYNTQGRRISATAANLSATYSYNALGQRVSKTVNGTTTRFVYDQQGHLLGEYNTTGQLIQEIVWLGDLPIAVLKRNAAQSTLIDVFYIHSDHLATPRKITRPSDNKVLWTWESEAFGNSLPNTNPSNLGNFSFNLRFPGQYYGQETGLHYNYFRDYDPGTGRYQESDPIGLAGGINTYNYVNGNPVNLIDPTGTNSIVIGGGVIVAGTGALYCALFPDKCRQAAQACVDAVGNMFNKKFVPKEDRDPKRFFDKGQADRAKERSKNADGNATCEYCGVETTDETGQTNSGQTDHIKSWATGGTTSDDNSAHACAGCNSSKGAKELGNEWIPPNQR